MKAVGAWKELAFFADDWPDLEAAIENDAREVLPPRSHRFAALEHTQPDATRVVILGQDPYPTPGHANGLAFSVAPDVALPKSLRNIYRELKDELHLRPTAPGPAPDTDPALENRGSLENHGPA